MQKPELELIYRNHKIQVWLESNSESPRTYCPLGTLILEHDRFYLVNETNLMTKSYDGWNDIYAELMKQNVSVIGQVILNESGGEVSLRAKRYTNKCIEPWDTSMVGFVYLTHEKLTKEYGRKLVNEELKTQAWDIMAREVAEYGNWINGEVYMHTIEDPSGLVIGNCGSWYGPDAIDESVAEAKRTVDHNIQMNPPGRYYLCMTDTRLGGTGKGKSIPRYRVVVACWRLEDAFKAFQAAQARDDLKDIVLQTAPPAYWDKRLVDRGKLTYAHGRYRVQVITDESGSENWFKGMDNVAIY